MKRSLSALLAAVLQQYPDVRRDQKFGRDSLFWPMIAELKGVVESLPVLVDSKRARVKVSFGQGNWAEVPNIAIMDGRETERPSAGLYLVFLLRADASAWVLSLNQGSADLIFEMKHRAHAVLRTRADRLRGALDVGALAAAGFTDTPLELASKGEYPRAYAEGNVVSKAYGADAMPSNEDLLRDLSVLHRAYLSVIPSSRLRPPVPGRYVPQGRP